MNDAALVGVLLLAIGALAFGCGPGAVQLHANAATVAYVTVAQAEDLVAGAHEAALDRVFDETEGQTRDAREAALRVEGAAWAPVLASGLPVRSALAAWDSAIELAAAAGGGADLVGSLIMLGARLARLYADVARLLNQVAPDVGLPDLNVGGL